MESKQVVRRLNYYYYGMLGLMLVASIVAHLLVMKDVLTPLDPMSSLGQVVQYVVILDAIITIPLGLWFHKRQCKQIVQVEDEGTRMGLYYKSAALRIVLVSNAMVLGIWAFYWMGGYQSMLWLAAISAIGWYFTKPTEKKLMLELLPPDQQY